MLFDSNFVTTKEQNDKTCRLLPWLWLSFAYFLPRWPAASEQEEEEEEEEEEKEEEEEEEGEENQQTEENSARIKREEDGAAEDVCDLFGVFEPLGSFSRDSHPEGSSCYWYAGE